MIASCMMSEARVSLLLEVLVLTGVAFVVEAFVLRFVFPGYFSPLWPHHTDFYMPLQIHNSQQALMDLVHWPRPVGVLYLYAVGGLGLHGSIAATMLVVLLNCALTAVIARHSLGMQRGGLWIAVFAVYTFLIFAHPRCYFIYRWDMLAQVSYFLLAMGMLLLLAFEATAGVVGFAALVFLGFLAKETYAPSLVLLVVVFSVLHFRSNRWRAVIGGITPFLAFAGSLLINRLNGSPFTGTLGDPRSTYSLALSPVSMLSEWMKYAEESALNWATGGLLLIAVLSPFLLNKSSLSRWIPLLLIISGVSAWLPNSVLPNHHFAGYAWAGAYLFFAPVLLLPLLWSTNLLGLVAGAAAFVLALASPSLSEDVYEGAENHWYIEQEAIQRKLLQGLTVLSQAFPGDATEHKLLVTGVNFPFSPFSYGRSLDGILDTSHLQLDVLAYSAPVPTSEGKVRFVSRNDVDLAQYDAVCAFGSDGSLLLNAPAPSRVASGFTTGDGIDGRDLILYPELFRRWLKFSSQPQSPDNTGAQLLACGATLLDYSELNGAEKCLNRASEVIGANPYPYYFLGLIRQKQGNAPEAHRLFQKAVALDDPSSPNPWFARKAAEWRQ